MTEGEMRDTNLDVYRVRRTLAQVKRKLEEALHLSRRQDEMRDERSAAARRHR
jgi:TfoX/Sxy family transcriptional regulator of competence genes